ncbi:cysteine desulfurase [Gammaproteobacteria bacterium]|nr:cysteine desulfurase [Gammaproteobacteria bacterium]
MSIWRQYFDYQSDSVYLDHASTSQTPGAVIEVMQQYYQAYRANVGRGVYEYAAQSTQAYEHSRQIIADLINAQSNELVFTYGATDGLNMVANALIAQILEPKQVILVSQLEHHSNLVPWQILGRQLDCRIELIPLDVDLNVDWVRLSEAIDQFNVGAIAITHMSNVTGQSIDIRRMCQIAKDIPVIVDGTQAISHLSVDVKELACAVYVFSAHKMYGPTGVGALYINNDYWPYIKPYRLGGGMIDEVTMLYSTFRKGPQMLEAGTPPIASVIGFAKAAELLQDWGVEKIAKHETALIEDLMLALADFPLKIYTSPMSATLSFSYEGAHAHDVATILSTQKIMVRSGHHCCMPLMRYLGEESLTRISLGCYNSHTDIEQLLQGLSIIKTTLKL